MLTNPFLFVRAVVVSCTIGLLFWASLLMQLTSS